MKLKDVVAHVRKDCEDKYGEALEAVEIVITHHINYPRDILFGIGRPRYTKAQFKEAVEKGTELPPLPEPPEEPKLPDPHAVYIMSVLITCRSKGIGSRQLRVNPVMAMTPARLFTKFVTECESAESKEISFPKDLL